MTNLRLNGKRLYVFSPKTRNKLSISTHITSIKYDAGGSRQSNQARKRNRRYLDYEEGNKLSLFTKNMITHVKNPMEPTKKYC